MGLSPNLAWERECLAQGHHLVAGVDEVGRGSWAGPLVAAAVMLPLDEEILTSLEGVRDSKELTPLRRQVLCRRIRRVALGIGVGMVSARWVDRLGLTQANRRAMDQAVRNLPHQPQALLIDAFRLPQMAIPQRAIVNGDELCLSIAAASIVAKVFRDGLMCLYGRQYPAYGFAEHKGYGTPQHQEALARLGPSPIHRLSYEPLAPWRDDGER